MLLIVVILCTLVLGLALLLMLEIGRRIGRRRFAADPEGAEKGLGAIEGAVFGLFGLLLAFSFSGATDRFATREDLINQEVNDVGTAWLRLDLLPVAAQPPLRQNFRDYLDARIATYRLLPDFQASAAQHARAIALQTEIWGHAVAACQTSGVSPATASLTLAALNSMFDITTTREAASRRHPPMIIYVMLVVLALGGALLIGHGTGGAKSRSWLHWLGYTVIISATLYVILDMEFPRFGLVRVDAADIPLIELRASMGQ